MTENPSSPNTTDSAEAALDAGLAAAFAPDATGDYQSRAAGFIPAEVAGTVIAGKYKLLERIGEGGMGSVWMAQQTEPVKRHVAVKLIKTGMDTKQVLARFEAERQALAVMDHPNIAKILDGGLSPPVATGGLGTPYFVMELVKGVPITKYCDDHKLTPRQRLELFVPVCQAIQHAHQKGIIHRDIKPSNVMVALYDDKPIPKVIDFGVAKATGQSLTDQTLNTGFGGIAGTPQYMSPEQASLNNLDIDTRSDIYSLGVLLYELLTGSPPFAQKDLEKAGMLEMLRVIREEEPPRPSTKLSTADALPSLSANRGTEPKKLTGILRNELDWIVMKALEKDRTRRYETANGFAADINRYLAGEPVNAHPPSAGYRMKKFIRRHKTQVTAATLLTGSLIAGILGTSWGLVRAETQRRRAVANEMAANVQSERNVKWATITYDIFKAFSLPDDIPSRDNLVRKALDQLPIHVPIADDLQSRETRIAKALDDLYVQIAPQFADDPELESKICTQLGSGYYAVKDWDSALRHYRRVINLASRHGFAEPFWVLKAAAQIQIMNGNLAAAEPLLERAAKVAKGCEPDDPFFVNSWLSGDTTYDLGRLQTKLKQYDSAERTIRRCVTDWERVVDSRRAHIKTSIPGATDETIRNNTLQEVACLARAQSQLGEILMAKNQLQEAHRLLNDAYGALELTKGGFADCDPGLVETLDRLHRHATTTGNAKSAAEWKAKRDATIAKELQPNSDIALSGIAGDKWGLPQSVNSSFKGSAEVGHFTEDSELSFSRAWLVLAQRVGCKKPYVNSRAIVDTASTYLVVDELGPDGTKSKTTFVKQADKYVVVLTLSKTTTKSESGNALVSVHGIIIAR